MATSEQSNWGAGIYRGRNAPAGSVFDAVNALVDDEGQMFRRPGTAYLSTSNAGSALLRVVAPYFVGPGASRVLAWGATDLYTVDGAGAPVSLKTTLAAPLLGRPALMGGYAIFPWVTAGFPALVYYAGSRKAANYAAGSFTVTNGSPVVTGAGTAWLANVDAGMIVTKSATEHGIVANVDSDTQLTLTVPWAGGTAAGIVSGINRTLTTSYGALPTPTNTTLRVLSAGSGQPRLLFVINNRAYMSAPGDPFSFDINTFHELPLGAEVTGGMPAGDSAVLFSSSGVWRIDNLSFDPVDDAGNVQQIVSQISSDLTLWGDSGLAQYAGAFVVPALDDVFLLAPDGSLEAISGSIRPLYRSYIKAGHRPGMGETHRGHYFLPVVDAAGTSVIDMLVCRLDRPFLTPGGRKFYPWTRWAGHAAGLGVAAQIGGGVAPRLVGISGQRVTDLTGCLDASGSASEADASTHTFTVDTSDFDTGPGIRPNTTEKVRFVYETTGGTPTVAASSAVGPEGASFTAAVLKRGGGASDGTDYSAWRVGRKAERIRFRFQCASAVTSLILRRLEVTVRQAGQS